jgi:pyrroline-5-carboxylate reductase
MKKIVIIGGGNMGEAIIKGLKRQVFVCESDTTKTKALAKKYKTVAIDISKVSTCDVIIFAVKPQDMGSVLSQVDVKNQLFISIAAGLTTAFFEKHLGGKARVIRSMPNMPALIGEGITGVASGRYATHQDLKTAQEILNSVGQTVIVKESMLDAVTAVSGSGPAYVFLFVEQWMAAAKALGFKEAEAKELVYQTLLGSAHLLKKSEFDAGTLREKVTSKGGTTQAALEVFAKGKFNQLFKNALLAANKRAQALAK